MKRKLTRLIILVTSSSLLMSCQSNDELPTDWEEHDLRGKVASVVDTAWLYDAAGTPAAEGTSGIPLFVKQTLQFNKAGKLTYKWSKWNNGNIYQDSLYYDDGLLVKSIRHSTQQGNNSVSELTIQYDSLRRKITESYRRGRNVYHYEGSNIRPSLKEEHSISTGKERHLRNMIYTYDSRGNLVKNLITSGDTDTHMTEIINEYDRKGNRISTITDHVPQNMDSEEKLKYNSKGDVIERIFQHENTAVNNVKTYEYQYDESGNWVVMETIKANGDRVINRRTITYFD